MTPEQPVEVKPDLLPCPFCKTAMRQHGQCFSHPKPAEGDCLLRHYSFDNRHRAQWNTRSPDPAPGEQLETAARAICCPDGCRNPEGSKFPCGWEAWKRQAAAALRSTAPQVPSVEAIAKFVEGWNGETREGDTFHIADEIRERFASGKPPQRPWCETCGTDVAEVLCPKCAKWWADNPQVPSEAVERALLEGLLSDMDEATAGGMSWIDHADVQTFKARAKARLASLPSLSEDTRSTAIGGDGCPLGEMHGMASCYTNTEGKRCCDFCGHPVDSPAPTEAAKLADERAQMLQDFMEQHYARCLRASEWDAIVAFLDKHPHQPPQAVDRDETERLRDLLDTERYKVAIGVQAVLKAVQGRQWLSEPGRGSYTYDDERYQQEFGAALTEIEAALEPLRAIARDWSDCPTDPLRVAANRSQALPDTSGQMEKDRG